MSTRPRLALAVLAAASGVACAADGGTAAPPIAPPPVQVTPPGRVTDLAPGIVTASSVTLTFTAVDDDVLYDLHWARDAAALAPAPLAPDPCRPSACGLSGLAPDADYRFAVVAFRETAAHDTLYGPPSNVIATHTPRPAPAGPPGQVTDLHVAAADDSSLTLRFTEVSDGAGASPRYDVRVDTGAIAWGSASTVTRGTCAAPLDGGAAGTERTCTVAGLAAGTRYGVQLVAYRGTADVDAVFGPLSNAASGTTASATPPPAGSAWPNEPSGFTPVSDQGWDALLSDGWNEEYNGPGLMTIVPDATAPLSPANVIQFLYPQGYSGGAAPALAYRGLPSAERTYVGLWWRANAEWEGHPAGDNKLAYLFTNSQGSVYLTAHGSGGGAPYELRVYPQFTTSNGEYLRPNVSSTPVTMGDWHRLEWLVEYTGGGRGRIRWWMDGQLMGDHADLAFPDQRLVEFKLSPVWGGAGGTKSRTDWFRYDHIRLTAH